MLRARLASEHGLSEYDAAILTQSKSMAGYFLDAVAAGGQPKLVCNWVTGELSRRLNEKELTFDDCPIDPPRLAWVVKLIDNGTISNNAARRVVDLLWNGVNPGVASATLEPNAAKARGHAARSDVESAIDTLGLRQMNDSSALEVIIDAVIAANNKSVEEFRQGKDKAFNALVGQIMKASGGKANPTQVNELLRKKLG